MKVGRTAYAVAGYSAYGNGIEKIDNASGANTTRQGLHKFNKNPQEEGFNQGKNSSKREHPRDRGVLLDTTA